MKLKSRAIGVLVLAVGLVAGASPAAASRWRPPKAMVKAYMAHEATSETTAQARLETQGRGWDLPSEMHRALGGEYGGVWFDNRSGDYVVDVARPSVALAAGPSLATTTAPARPYLQSSGLEGQTQFAQVSYSQEQLESAKEVLDGRLAKLLKKGQVTTAIDTEANAIVVHESNALAKGKLKKIAAYAQEAGVTVDTVPVQPAAVEISAQACVNRTFQTTTGNSQFLFCTRSLRGGVSIVDLHAPGGASVCSLGFIVTNSMGEYIMTAGHCVAGEGNPDWVSASTDWTSSHEVWQPIGTENGAYMGEEGDFAWVKVTAPGSPWFPINDPSSVANLTSAGWPENESQFLENAAWSAQGDFNCHTGGATDTQCGTVLSTDQWAYYDQRWVGKLTTDTYCSAPGDSGGTVWGNHSGMGMHVASNGLPCGSGHESLYTEAIRDAILMGLSFYVPPYNQP